MVSQKTRQKIDNCFVAYMCLFWPSAQNIYWLLLFIIWFPIIFKKIIQKRRYNFKIHLFYNHPMSIGRWNNKWNLVYSQILKILRVKRFSEKHVEAVNPSPIKMHVNKIFFSFFAKPMTLLKPIYKFLDEISHLSLIFIYKI